MINIYSIYIIYYHYYANKFWAQKNPLVFNRHVRLSHMLLSAGLCDLKVAGLNPSLCLTCFLCVTSPCFLFWLIQTRWLTAVTYLSQASVHFDLLKGGTKPNYINIRGYVRKQWNVFHFYIIYWFILKIIDRCHSNSEPYSNHKVTTEHLATDPRNISDHPKQTTKHLNNPTANSETLTTSQRTLVTTPEHIVTPLNQTKCLSKPIGTP